MHTAFAFSISHVLSIFIYMICTCDAFFIVQINSSFSFQLQVAAILYCTRSLDLLLTFIFWVFLLARWQDMGLMEKKAKRENQLWLNLWVRISGSFSVALYNIYSLLNYHYQALLFRIGSQHPHFPWSLKQSFNVDGIKWLLTVACSSYYFGYMKD